MKHFIFGFDSAHPQACAEALKARGIDAVVVGGLREEAALALQNAGLELWLCYGAHGLNDRARKSVDADGIERVWFGSACPNDLDLADTRLDAALNAARQLPGVSGIFVDGARFASFASAEGADAFFTCFCPACMARMSSAGLDAQAIRQAVAQLKHGEAPDLPRLREWLAFREMTVRAYMERFAARVHEADARWQAGAFVFAPSLGRFVGQTAAACEPLDIVSPMLYRAYPHADGPACMGHEWAGCFRLLQQSAAALCSLTGDPVHQFGAQDPDTLASQLLHRGFPPEAIGSEVSRARRDLRPGQQLLPILQIEDDRLSHTRRIALAQVADGVGYFAFGQAELPD